MSSLSVQIQQMIHWGRERWGVGLGKACFWKDHFVNLYTTCIPLIDVSLLLPNLMKRLPAMHPVLCIHILQNVNSAYYIHLYLDQDTKGYPQNIYLCSFYWKHLGILIKYSRLLLSRFSLSRITVYLEVKIWSLFEHGNLTIGNKILWKRIFSIISNFWSQITCSFVKCGCFFLNSANLICRGMDISKYFTECLGLWDYESWLYISLISSLSTAPNKALFNQKYQYISYVSIKKTCCGTH